MRVQVIIHLGVDILLPAASSRSPMMYWRPAVQQQHFIQSSDQIITSLVRRFDVFACYHHWQYATLLLFIKGNQIASAREERVCVLCNKYWWHSCFDAEGTKFIGLIVKIPLPAQALQDLRALVCLFGTDDTITPNKSTASGVMALICVPELALPFITVRAKGTCEALNNTTVIQFSIFTFRSHPQLSIFPTLWAKKSSHKRPGQTHYDVALQLDAHASFLKGRPSVVTSCALTRLPTKLSVAAVNLLCRSR